MLIKDKKGIELTMQTIVVFIILLVTLVVIIFFFTNHYSANQTGLMNVSTVAIDNAIRG